MLRIVLACALVVAGASSCASDDEDGVHRVVATTSILGDVVSEIVGDTAVVDVVMPAGTDPHDFSPAARQVAAMRDADLLVVNGGGFEAGLDDAIDAARADGVEVFDAVAALEDEPGMASGGDPHVFTDPVRMQHVVAELIAAIDGALGGAAGDRTQRGAAYTSELIALHEEIEAEVAAIPEARRVLVTNHDVLGHFAERYGFEIVGVVIEGGSTLAEPSSSHLADLAGAVAAAGVAAIFVETSAPAALAETLAAEVGGDVDVVELYTESLGDPGSDGGTYLDMVRTNVQRIVAALS